MASTPVTLRVVRQWTVGLLIAVALVMCPRALAQVQSTVPYPGTTMLPPFGSVRFLQFREPGSQTLPAAALNLLVVSQSDQPTTVTYDGRTLTIAAPPGYAVQILFGCAADGPPSSQVSCPRPPDGQASLGMTQRGVSFTTVVMSEQTETVQLVAGCNNVTLTWPDGTVTSEVAAAVSPLSALLGMWRFDSGRQTYEGFSPLAPGASDLTSVNRTDAVFICLSTPGTLSRPSM